MYTIYLGGDHYGYVATAAEAEHVRTKFQGRFAVSVWFVPMDLI